MHDIKLLSFVKFNLHEYYITVRHGNSNTIYIYKQLSQPYWHRDLRLQMTHLLSRQYCIDLT